MTSDVALAKLASIAHCLHRIRTVTRNDPAAVRDIDIQDIVVLNLQRATQAAIDLAAHIIAAESWGLPSSLKEHFTILAREKVVDDELGKHLEGMVGFRNVAVHAYEAIDTDILEAIVAHHLNDIDAFCAAVRRYLTKKASAPGGHSQE
ncbi:MAG: DUF86 domain-containing protein [Candidatus Binatia bacterium]